ncbi:MAG: hypothetical protein O7G83_18640 [Proteobacteria bacterium]|nr:hypothetical protein [Pseudomonadota bacterium]
MCHALVQEFVGARGSLSGGAVTVAFHHDLGGAPDTLSQREKVTGPAFDRQIGSTTSGDRYADCRIRPGFAFDRHICYATDDRKR